MEAAEFCTGGVKPMLQTAEIFGDGMVLQMAKLVPVWGTGVPGRTVQVRIRGGENPQKKEKRNGRTEEKSTTVGPDGKWNVRLDGLSPASGMTMTVTDGEDTLEYHDVAVGEVWLAGGQSNMEYLMGFDAEREQERELLRQCGELQRIRFFSCPKISWEGEEEQYDYSSYGFWRKCTAEDLDFLPAVPYYFARQLAEKFSDRFSDQEKAVFRDVPIGIVDCTWGGTRAMCWMTEEKIRESGGEAWLADYEAGLRLRDPEEEAEEYRKNPLNAPTDPFRSEFDCRVLYPGLTREEQEARMREIKEENAQSEEQGNPVIIGLCHPWRPAGLYHTMLEKIIPYAVRGVIYYQGESDAQKAELYEDMLTGLIGLWREKWGEELPFLMVQLAPFEIWYEESGERYPEIRQAQQNVADRMPKVWLASNGDAGMRYDIHPKHKRPVGYRLALLALKHVYGADIAADAPRCTGAVMKGQEIELSFSHVKEFCVKGNRINALRVYDGDRELSEDEYTAAPAEEDAVRGDTGNILKIMLNSPLKNPKVKFAQTGYYEVNLYNEEMIPALPFEAGRKIRILQDGILR
ncbi:hypothetical protein B5F07_08010 [Lachnoclostridium sp. An169]|nr:hypothetical protein B5F07_08010 [Lachnoclostridium sp. An169]